MINSFWFCKPNCPDRKPACQDHCEFHAERKRIYAEKKAKAESGKKADQYVSEAKANNYDRRVKRERAFGGSKWRRTGRR